MRTQHAAFNMRLFRNDLWKQVGAPIAPPRIRRIRSIDEGNDLIGFRLYANGRICDVLMPDEPFDGFRSSEVPSRMVGIMPGAFYLWWFAVREAARMLGYPDPAVPHD